jgi:hypothetical protein
VNDDSDFGDDSAAWHAVSNATEARAWLIGRWATCPPGLDELFDGIEYTTDTFYWLKADRTGQLVRTGAGVPWDFEYNHHPYDFSSYAASPYAQFYVGDTEDGWTTEAQVHVSECPRSLDWGDIAFAAIP